MKRIVTRTLWLLVFWFVSGLVYNIWIQTGDTQMALNQMNSPSNVYITSKEALSQMFWGMVALISCCFGVWIAESIIRKVKNEG